MYTGPKLTNDDLVFGYDTGYGVADNATSTRFYPGEPTTNLYTNSDFSNGETGWTFGSWDGNISHTATTVVGPYGEVVSANKLTVNSASSYSHFHQYNGSKYTSGNTYTTSAWVKGNGVFQIKSHWGGNVSLTLTGKWQRISQTVTATSSSSGNFPYLAGEGLTVGTDCYVTMCQTELKSHATPYVYSGSTTGSRSNTTSLIDLKGETDINVSSVSFTSTGQPSYDETDDHITGVLPMSGLGQPHTIEMIFSCNVNQGSIGSRKDPFSIGNSTTHQYSALDVNAGNMNWYFYSKDTTFTNSPLMVADQFYHIVLSYAGGYSNNTNKKVWINGVQQTLSTGVNETPLLPNNPSFSVGRDRGRNTAYWPGEVPVWKVYQKALTQDDAISNYKAYKNRFNL